MMTMMISHTSDLEVGTLVATLPGAWCYRVSAGTDWPGVSILRLGERESLIGSFCLSVAVRSLLLSICSAMLIWCHYYHFVHVCV